MNLEREIMKNADWENVVNLVLGVWLFVSPWSVPHGAMTSAAVAADWNFWIVGIIVAVSAGMALQDIKPWEEWLDLVLGVWMFLSPWILGFSKHNALFINALIVGGIITVLSALALQVVGQRRAV